PFECKSFPNLPVVLNGIEYIDVPARHSQNLVLFQKTDVNVLVRSGGFAQDTGLSCPSPIAIRGNVHLPALFLAAQDSLDRLHIWLKRALRSKAVCEAVKA